MASVISVLAKLKADTSSYVSGMGAARKATESFTRTAADGATVTSESWHQNMTKMGDDVSKMGATAVRIGSIVKAAVLGFVTIQGAQFLRGAIKGASAFEAEFEGVNQMFGDGAKKVQDFAKNAAYSAGLAENTALRFAKSFGGYAKSAGLAGDAQAQFATQMVQAAGDLGSFFDLPTESALMAIQQGLRGEYEPLRRFNILLDENSIGQKAMALGVSKTGKNLTQQQKVLVRQAAIMDQMGVAQGDFVKYGDTYGNQIKTTSALFQNLQKDVGSALLPAMAALAKAAVPLIQVLGPLLTTAVAALTPVIDAVTLAMGSLEPVLKPIIDTFSFFAKIVAEAVKSLLPSLLQILAPIMQLFSDLAKPIASLATSLLPALGSILTAIAQSFAAMLVSIQPIIPVLTTIGKSLALAFVQTAPYIAEFIKLIATLVIALMPLIPPILNLVTQLLPTLVNLFKSLAPVILLLAQYLGTLLVGVIVALAKLLLPIAQKIVEAFQWMANKLIEFINFILPIVTPVINGIIDGINSVLAALGMKKIGKLPKNVKVEAFKQGEDLGKMFADGFNGTGSLADLLGGDGTGGGGGGGGTGTTPTNPVTDFYKKLSDEIKQQRAKTKLISMGLNADLAQQVVSLGDGWTKVYKKIKNGGTKAIDNLQSKFAQTAAGMAKIADAVKSSMADISNSIVSGFDITKLGVTAEQVLGNARRLVDKAKQFGAEIVSLAKAGLNRTLLNQIIAAGPVEGLRLAKSLNASGAGSISELNSLYGQIQDVGMATAAGVAGEQTNYYIEVSGGVGDKNSIGKAIVEAIKAYERQSGTTWRA